jgi:hypothetical protein
MQLPYSYTVVFLLQNLATSLKIVLYFSVLALFPWPAEFSGVPKLQMTELLTVVVIRQMTQLRGTTKLFWVRQSLLASASSRLRREDP